MQHFPHNLVAVFLLASVSYYLVERPLNRLGHKLTARPKFGVSVPQQTVLIGSKLPLAASGAGTGRRL
jgi:peptidoglycan/LPS O-acetylase OafA/YrhL